MKTCMTAIFLFVCASTAQALYQGQDIQDTEVSTKETRRNSLPSKRQLHLHVEGLCSSIEDYVNIVRSARNQNIDEMTEARKQALVNDIRAKRNRMRYFASLILKDTEMISEFPKDHPIALTASESYMIFLHVRLRTRVNETMRALFNAKPLELLQDFEDHILRRNWVRRIEDLRLERGEKIDQVNFLDIYRAKIYITLNHRIKALIH